MIRPSIMIVTACLACPSLALASGAADAAIPWADWLSAALASVSSALVPLAAAAVTAGVARVAPWASSLLTRQRIEAAIRAGVDYGLNAVAGAARGRPVSIDAGPSVVAAATRHVVETAPAPVVRRAGGVEGVASRIFGALPLDAQGSIETVLRPALRLLKDDPPRRA